MSVCLWPFRVTSRRAGHNRRASKLGYLPQFDDAADLHELSHEDIAGVIRNGAVRRDELARLERGVVLGFPDFAEISLVLAFPKMGDQLVLSVIERDVCLAVILGSDSRKVVGWALERGVQYASGDYVRILRKHQMIPSMSRPANPYDNASCESFMKTLKREEICAYQYRDLDHLRANIQEFIEQYYNRQRLQSRFSTLPWKSPAAIPTFPRPGDD